MRRIQKSKLHRTLWEFVVKINSPYVTAPVEFDKLLKKLKPLICPNSNGKKKS